VSTGLTSNVSPVKRLPVEIVEDKSQGISCRKASEPKFMDTAAERTS